MNLPSESRLGILQELQLKELRMQEIARTLNLTDTETCRQLQRLSEARLIEKLPSNTYRVTNYTKLLSQLVNPVEFVFNNANYFFDHNVFDLPYTFIDRLGELSQAEFCKEAMAGFNQVRTMIFDAKDFIWTMAEQVDTSHIQPTQEKVSRGLDFKFIMQQEIAKKFANAEGNEILSGCKYLQYVPVTLVITENEATVVFRRFNGVMDYMGLFGKDNKFCTWCKDLFLYYWEKAHSWYPGIKIE